MKKLALSLCMLLMAIGSWAAKAYNEPAIVTQNDGTQLTVFVFGDEDHCWYTTGDGVLLAHIGNDYFVAAIDHEGRMTPTAQLAHDRSLRTTAEQQLVKAQEPYRKAFFSRLEQQRQTAEQRRIVIGTTSPAYFPHMGNPKALVILVQFSDLNFSVEDPMKSFNDYLNGTRPLANYGLREDRNYGSVREYFTDMSQGLFTPQFDVYGPVTLEKSWTYYGKDPSSDSPDYSSRIQELIREACAAIDGDVDFSAYDSNGDKCVDLVYIIYAGYAQSISGNSSDCIWPKSSTTSGGSYDGVNVSRYGLNNELNYYPGRQFSSGPDKRINGIGLFCHEFSHTMGLPDLYPTGNSTGKNYDNQTMEYWDVMDGGEYTDNGYTPTPYTPWEKEVMEWIEIDELIYSPQKISMEEGKTYRISSDENNEYLILQNLQNTSWASKLLGHGMLIYRIDYSDVKGNPRNTVNMSDSPNNTGGKPAITLLINYYRVYGSDESNKTDKKPYSQSEYVNSHYGDPYPGAEGVVEVSSIKMNSCTIEKPIYNIKEEDGIISFDYLKDFTPDGITTVTSGNTQADNMIYDLQGRKVISPGKGIFIRNHKKVVAQ